MPKSPRIEADAASPRPPAPGAPVRRLLVTGPPGSGKSRHALGLFDEVVRADGADTALVVFPTYGQVEHAKRLAISRRGDRPDVRGLLDVSYVTFTSLGERIADGFRVGALPSRRARDRLADEALRASDAPAFRAVRDRPGFRARFLRLVKELKQTGEAPRSLLPRARAAASVLPPGPRERLEAFLDGWGCYEEALARAAVPDHEDALRSLVEGLARAGGTGLDSVRLLVVDGFEDFSGVEALLVDALGDAVVAAGGRVVVTLPWDDARADLYPATAALRARLVTAEGFVETRMPGFVRAEAAGLRALAVGLFATPSSPRPPDGGPVANSSGVSVLVGSDPADEWDRIGRDLLRRVRANEGTGFRDVGVVVRRLDGVAPTARRVLERLGIPVRLVGGGEALATEPVVRVLGGGLRLLAGDDGLEDHDFDAHALLDLWRWRALDSGEPLDVDAVDATDLRWRTKRLPTSWPELLLDLEAHAPRTLLPAARRLEAMKLDASATREPAALLARAIDELLPLSAPGGLDADGRPMDAAGDLRLARARAAKRRLLALVEESGAHAAGEAGSPSFVAFVAEILAATEEASCEPADRRLDAVSLLDAEEARHWELPVVYVAGLIEKGFPLHPREDVFLRDEDREALGAQLAKDARGPAVPWRTTGEAEVKERRLFLTAVTRARRHLVLSRAARDESGRESSPSFFWRDAARALGLAADGPARFGADPADLDRAAPPLVDVATEDDLRRAIAAAGPSPGADGARGPASDASIAAWLARARRFRRPIEDVLPASATAAFLRATERLSPSSIQTGLDCPYRFFLARVARVPDDDAPLRGSAADRRRFGVWIHAVFEKAVKEPDRSDEELVAEVMAEKASDVPDGADRAWYADDLLRVLALFRAREAVARASGYLPAPGDVEIDFGKASRDVELGAGAGAFLLTGRIDRLDTSAGEGPRRAIVVDYKTTAGTATNAARELRRVEELQLALYGRAIENVRGVTVVGLEHYAATSPLRAATIDVRAAAEFVARREGRPAIELPTADFRETLLRGAERRASEVVAVVRRGAGGGHRKAPLSRARCARCAFEAVCRPDVDRFALVAVRPDDAARDELAEGDGDGEDA